MKRISFCILAALFAAASAPARNVGFGIDAFNRVVPASAGDAAVFSPLSFEIDSVAYAETVDPIRRAVFANALNVMDEFEAEYGQIARLPFEGASSNGFDVAWIHAFAVDDPRLVNPSFRVTVQDLYGVEVCRVKRARGVEAWVRAMFVDAFPGWRLPPLPDRETYALHDLVSVRAEVAPSNGWKRVCPTHFVYRQPLLGGADFYAVVPKPGRAVSSVRGRVTSVTLPEILSMRSAVVNPPEPVRLRLPAIDTVTTNELAGAFAYFHFPTAALKPFPPGMKPASLRQLTRFRLKTSADAAARRADADKSAADVALEGPFLFFVHDPRQNTLPIAGIHSGK